MRLTPGDWAKTGVAVKPASSPSTRLRSIMGDSSAENSGSACLTRYGRRAGPFHIPVSGGNLRPEEARRENQMLAKTESIEADAQGWLARFEKAFADEAALSELF